MDVKAFAKGIRCWQQAGQANVEYVVVTAAVVFALMQPYTPTGAFKCPGGESSCNVLQILAQAMRNRYEGYSYAISASEYPMPAVNYPPASTGKPCGGRTPCGAPFPPSTPSGGGTTDIRDADGNVIGYAIGSKAFDNAGKEIGTVAGDGSVTNSAGDVIGSTGFGGVGGSQLVAVDLKGNPIGQLNSDTYVVDDLKVRVGKKDKNSDDVFRINADGTLFTDKNGDTEVIGKLGKVNADGDVIDAKGNKIGTT
jgi:hypothetical protein